MVHSWPPRPTRLQCLPPRLPGGFAASAVGAAAVLRNSMRFLRVASAVQELLGAPPRLPQAPPRGTSVTSGCGTLPGVLFDVYLHIGTPGSRLFHLGDLLPADVRVAAAEVELQRLRTCR